jgi:ArsR family transcriptional regulator
MAPLPDILELKADLLRAFAQPTRLKILTLLRTGERHVGDICRALQEGQPTVSRHLAVLHRSGVVSARKEGLRVLYRIGDEEVVAILNAIDRMLERQLRLGYSLARKLA